MKKTNFRDKMIKSIVQLYQNSSAAQNYPIHFFKEENLNWNSNLINFKGQKVPTVDEDFKQYRAAFSKLQQKLSDSKTVSKNEKLAVFKKSRFITHDLNHAINYDERVNISNDQKILNKYFKPVLDDKDLDLTKKELEKMDKFAHHGFEVLKTQTEHLRPNTVIIDIPFGDNNQFNFYCTIEDNSWYSQELISKGMLKKMTDEQAYTLADFVYDYELIWKSNLIAEDDNYIAFDSSQLCHKYIFDKKSGNLVATDSLNYDLNKGLSGTVQGLDFDLIFQKLD